MLSTLMCSAFFMKNSKRIGLYVILDKQYIADCKDLARYAVKKNIRYIQYRDKNSSNDEFINNVKKIVNITKGTKSNFIINDRVNIAKEINADGIHIGQEDTNYEYTRDVVSDKIIGISTHNLQQAINAEKIGADYIGIGPIFKTSSKRKPDPVIGLEGLKKISAKISIPKVAIGGINRSNVRSVMNTGVDGCAIISSILNSDDPKNEIDKILEILNEKI